MAKKNALITARLPRGFEDRGVDAIAATDTMIAKIREVYERYGFDPMETPFFEYTDALGKFLPDADRPNEGVFSLQDEDEQWMSLRYDLTAPLARYVAENFQDLTKPFRSYRAGYVFRNEKPGPGRFRQFMQFDADTVGAAGPEADAEMCMMMADTMDALGLKGKYVVRVNNRKVLDGVLESIGVTSDQQKLAALRAIDKLDKFGNQGVRLLLGKGRKDESGDFTAGAGLDEVQISELEKLYAHREERSQDMFVSEGAADALPDDQLVRPADAVAMIVGNPRFLDVYSEHFGANEKARSGLEELKTISALVRAAGYGTKRIRMDVSVVRGLEYYTGPVFEIELTFPVTNEKGEEVVFGSVGGGGRYDGLVSRFRKEPVPATGFSIGVSRLATALRLTGNLAQAARTGPVVVLVMDREQIPRYQEMTAELRRAGVRAEMFLGSTKNFGKQVAYADKRNSPAVVIEGSQEREEGIVQIKDLVAGKLAAAEIADNAEWKAERPGQFAVPRVEMVAAIKKLVDAG